MEKPINPPEPINDYEMANDPAFLFYPGDYLRDTQCLSEACQVAYDRIMCEHMRIISGDMNNIRVTQKMLNFFTKRLSLDEKDDLLAILTPIEDGFQIKWVADSIYKRVTYSNSRRENRQGKGNITSLSHDTHMDNENDIVNEDVLLILNVSFDDFWALYDKKVGEKGKLTKKWTALKPAERIAAMEHIPKYKIAQPDKKYRKDPSTYLNNKSWNDEIIYENQNLNGTNKESAAGNGAVLGTSAARMEAARKW